MCVPRLFVQCNARPAAVFFAARENRPPCRNARAERARVRVLRPASGGEGGEADSKGYQDDVHVQSVLVARAEQRPWQSPYAAHRPNATQGAATPGARRQRRTRPRRAPAAAAACCSLSLSHSLSHSHSLFGWLACVAEIRLTEKVGYSVGLDPIEIGDDPDVQRVVKGLLDASRLPQEKYQEPATSAQEVGWFHEPLVVANPRFVHKIHQAPRMQVLTTAPAPLPHRFVHKIHQGEVTKFAEVYTKKMAGAHMFHGSSGKYLKF